jgi:hypothetical protein
MPITTISLLLIWMLIIFVGCGEKYGIIHSSLKVSQMFETHEVLDDYKYYFSGSNDKPRGIIGIHKNYTLDSSLWKPVDLTSQQLKSWMDNISNYNRTTFSNYGAFILDPSGKQIGVWYSKLKSKDEGTIKMKDDNHIMVTTPDDRDIDND